MARSVERDPYHKFRFAVQFGYEGEKLGFSRVDIRPTSGNSWRDGGEVALTKALGKELIALMEMKGDADLLVSAFHITDEFGVDGKPSMTIMLKNVVPAKAELGEIVFDAASSDVLTGTITMRYDSLHFLTPKTGPLKLLALSAT